MKAIICGSQKLFAHLCLLINMFLKAGYLPIDFMQALVVPLVKCKTGNLAGTNSNNYRAIAISNALSKLFESVIAKEVFTYADCEKHHFGLKAHHVADILPQFSLGTNLVQFVTEFKYLSHMITDSLTDDADMQREVRNLFVRTNTLRRRFYKCSVVVKRILFKTYCICLYDAAPWSRYNKGSLRKLSSC